ncbi:MAG: glycosyltransferase [Spirochaetaceae bacterium]|nr:glycosyltransferase [Spirochaetaceae bacterium]MCF7947180.1 glycosyltransferase [Spirochaetia bacterium]MCF7950045.1 glycosyltransferase [Spirochaetaceae bacterium]
MKKIIIYLVNFNKGGAEWVITNLANTMADNGRPVTIVSIKFGNMSTELSSTVNYKHFSGQWLKAFWYMYRKLWLNRFDVMLTTQRGGTVFAYLLKIFSFSKTKHVVREAASNFNQHFESKGFLTAAIWRRLFRLSYGHAYRLIVNSAGTGEDLISAGIISDKSYYQIDNPLDIDRIRQKALMENKFTKPPDMIQIVTIARLVPKKCIDVLIHAYERVRVHYPQSRLVIVGDGPLKEELEQIVSKLGLNNHVVFAGWLSNPYPVLRESNLFVLPSKWEGFGQVLIEALALGVPCVSTDTSDSPSYILDKGQYGILVEPESFDGLAAGILQSLNQNHKALRLIKRAEMFNKQAITGKYEQVFFLE